LWQSDLFTLPKNKIQRLVILTIVSFTGRFSFGEEMDSNSERLLEKVHPQLKEKVTELIAVLAGLGIEVRVVQGLRSFEEQNILFAKRPKVTNARGGQSNHNYGLAVDLCPFKNGLPQWNDTSVFNSIGREAEKLGLEWGGRWKFVDKPHVQLRGMSIKDCQSSYKQGGIVAVWQRMSDLLSGTATPSVFIPAGDDLIEFGDIGGEVINLQKQLVKLKLIHAHEVDGDFGKITRNAVIAFQRLNKLTADGIVGPGTKTKLLEQTK
jgi:hypothetical protein